MLAPEPSSLAGADLAREDDEPFALAHAVDEQMFPRKRSVIRSPSALRK
jgi:hypothetical protein